MMKWQRIASLLLIVSLFLLPSASQAMVVDPPAEEWSMLWQYEGGDRVYIKERSMVSLNALDGAVVYGAVLMSEWSPNVKNDILEQADFLKDIPKDQVAGIAYEVHMDMSRWAYRIDRIGYVNSAKEIVWSDVIDSPWRTLIGNSMAEPLSALSIKIYNQRQDIPTADYTISPHERLNYDISSEAPWLEFGQSSWGRYFFLPSEIMVKKLPDGEGEREVFQVLVRSDWSQRAQKEAPRIENIIRQSEKRTPIRGLENTDTDYMIWCLDLKEAKRSYMAGVYLNSKNERIHKEDSFMNFHWTVANDPTMGGALAAYLLSHPEAEIPDGGESPQVELPEEWSGKIK